MRTLVIRKKSAQTWLHTDSILGDFIISNFDFSIDNNEFQIVERGQAKRIKYTVSNITVYDETAGNNAEVFGTITALSIRLENLNYPPFLYRNSITTTPNGQFGNLLTIVSRDFIYNGSNIILNDFEKAVQVFTNRGGLIASEWVQTLNELIITPSVNYGALEIGDLITVVGFIDNPITSFKIDFPAVSNQIYTLNTGEKAQFVMVDRTPLIATEWTQTNNVVTLSYIYDLNSVITISGIKQ